MIRGSKEKGKLQKYKRSNNDPAHNDDEGDDGVEGEGQRVPNDVEPLVIAVHWRKELERLAVASLVINRLTRGIEGMVLIS